MRRDVGLYEVFKDEETQREYENALREQKEHLKKQIYSRLIDSAQATLDAKISSEKVAVVYESADEMGVSYKSFQRLSAQYSKRLQYFSREYQDVYDALHSLQQSEQLPQDINRECYRVFEYYFEGIVAGGFPAYFRCLLEQVFEEGKIDWSAIPKRDDIEYLEDCNIDCGMNMLMSPRVAAASVCLKTVRTTVAELNHFGEETEADDSSLQTHVADIDDEDFYDIYAEDEIAAVSTKQKPEISFEIASLNAVGFFVATDSSPRTVSGAVTPGHEKQCRDGVKEVTNISCLPTASLASHASSKTSKTIREKRARDGAETDEAGTMAKRAQTVFFAYDHLSELESEKRSRGWWPEGEMSQSDDPESNTVKRYEF